MTIEGAIAELQNLIKADDVPFYYNGAIQKVIETIIDECKPKVGRWIDTNMTCCGAKVYKCSVCDNEIDEMPTEMGEPIWNYCPNCGAKMERSE